MKKFKSIIIMLIVLLLTMSCFVACGPSGDDDENWVVDGGTGPNNNNNITTDPNNPSTPGTNNTTPGTNNTTPGTNNTTPGTNNTTPGSNNTTPGANNTTTPEDDKSPIGNMVALTENPILNKNKKENHTGVPSVDVDKTGFSKGTVADMKGKSLTLYYSHSFATFHYYDTNGKKVIEHDWYKDVKKAYGLTVKFMKATGASSSVLKPFQAMSAGKDCDLLTTDLTSWPYVCNILAPMDKYANFDNFTNNPALDTKFTELSWWKGHPIVLSPCFAFEGIVYNKTELKNYGMEDPYELFQKNQWTWTNFKKIMVGLPDKTKDGKTLIGMGTMGHSSFWPSTNGAPAFQIDTENPNGGIINNWDTPELREAYVWLEGVCDAGGNYTFGYPGSFWDPKEKPNMRTLMTRGGMDYADFCSVKELANYDWVPFPRNEGNSKSFCIVDSSCLGIGLARKTNKESNRTAAMKFCEVYISRKTEAAADNLLFRVKVPYEKYEYMYNYARQYTVAGFLYGLGDFQSKAVSAFRLHEAVTSASLSVAAALEKCSNVAKQEVAACLKFGEQ